MNRILSQLLLGLIFLAFHSHQSQGQAFITTWSTGDGTITILTHTDETYLYDVYWERIGDPLDNGSLPDQTGDALITGLLDAALYRVEITGQFPRIYFNGSPEAAKLMSIEQWGNIQWTSFEDAFNSCFFMVYNAIDAPDLTGVSSLRQMFLSCSTMGSPNLNSWDVSGIEDMAGLFYAAFSFNGDVSQWETGNVQHMNSMFEQLPSFNGDLSGWDVSSVVNMGYMFWNSPSFNSDISEWNTSTVGGMPFMFENASSFDQNLGGWDLSSIVTGGMYGMLNNSGLSKANYDATLIGWYNNPNTPDDVSFSAQGLKFCDAKNERLALILDKGWTIDDAGSDCPFITTWNTENAGATSSGQVLIPTTETGYNYTVYWEEAGNPANNGNAGPFDDLTMPHILDFGAPGIYRVEISGDFPRIHFNNDDDRLKILTIEQWGDIQWISMQNAFYGCANLTVPATDAPNLTGVTNLNSMFSDATSFNQPVGHWNVSNVTNMGTMFFNASAFNQDLSAWNVALVETTNQMFQDAASFDQSLGSWNIGNVSDMGSMLDNCGMSVANYDATLIGWAAQSVQSDVPLGANGLFHSIVGQAARDILTSAPNNWQIDGDALVAAPAAPSGVIAYASSPDEITLEWIDNSTTETSFTIERASDYDFTIGVQTALSNIPANSTTAVAYVGGNQGYFFRVIAVNGSEDATSRSGVEFGTTRPFPGHALEFDGLNSYVTAYTGSALTVAAFYTVEAWVKPSSVDQMVVFSTRTATVDFGFDMQLIGGNTIHADIGNGTGWITTSADAAYNYSPGTWMHLAYAVTPAGYTVYVDGELVGSGSFGGTPLLLDATHDYITIGAENNNGGTLFGGSIDEVRVWNYAKSDFNDRFNRPNGNEAGLVAYYSFDENVGQKAVDRSIYNHDADLINGPVFVESGVLSGSGNYAVEFNGTQGYIEAGGFEVPSGDFTLEAWVYYYGQVNEFEGIMEFEEDSPWLGVKEGKLHLYEVGGDAELLTSGVWTHVAVTYNSTNQTAVLYRNGLDVTGAMDASGTTPFTGTKLLIGGDPDVIEYFHGVIDEIRIWDRELTSGEILAGMTGPLSGSETDLLAYYDFNEAPGAATIADISGHGRNGNLMFLNNVTARVQGTLFSDMVFGTITVQDLELSPADVALGSTENLIYKMFWQVEDYPVDFMGMIVTIAGDYDEAQDFTPQPFKVYYNMSDDLVNAQEFGPYAFGDNGSGFPAEIGQSVILLDLSLSLGDHYFWITTDIAPSATPGSFFYVQAFDLETQIGVGDVERIGALNDGALFTIVSGVVPPVALEATNITVNSFEANWEPVSGAQGYLLDVSRTDDFSIPVWTDEPLAGTSVQVSFLLFSQSYFYRLRTDFGGGVISEYSNIIHVKTLLDPNTTLDSLRLVEIYDATGGPNWTVQDNWKTGRLRDWAGLYVQGTRVQSLALNNNGLTGTLPLVFNETDPAALGNLLVVDVSQNELTDVSVLGTLPSLQTVNVSFNQLDFGDLEPLAGAFTTFFYAPQNTILGTELEEQLDRGANRELLVDAGGTTTEYQWRYEGENINGANESSYIIEELSYFNMGTYDVEATNTLLPDLTLNSHPMTVWAQGNLQVNVTYQSNPLADGTGYLLKIGPPGLGYDTLLRQNFSDGLALFSNIRLGDYLFAATGNEAVVLPTYYSGTFLWEDAETLEIRELNTEIDLAMIARPPGLTPADGDGLLFGLIETDFPDDFARNQARKRSADCPVAVQRSSAIRGENNHLELVAYVRTDENGDFEIPYLPDGEYFINIQYPGIRMDPNTFLSFTVNNQKNEFEIAATITPNGIFIDLIEALGTRKQYFEELSIYPNPAKDRLIISFGNVLSDQVRISMFDIQGRKVRDVSINRGAQEQLELNLTDLNDGMYILNVYEGKNGQSLSSYKIIIRR
jgi:surface protein